MPVYGEQPKRKSLADLPIVDWIMEKQDSLDKKGMERAMNEFKRQVGYYEHKERNAQRESSKNLLRCLPEPYLDHPIPQSPQGRSYIPKILLLRLGWEVNGGRLESYSTKSYSRQGIFARVYQKIQTGTGFPSLEDKIIRKENKLNVVASEILKRIIESEKEISSLWVKLDETVTNVCERQISSLNQLADNVHENQREYLNPIMGFEDQFTLEMELTRSGDNFRQIFRSRAKKTLGWLEILQKEFQDEIKTEKVSEAEEILYNSIETVPAQTHELVRETRAFLRETV